MSKKKKQLPALTKWDWVNIRVALRIAVEDGSLDFTPAELSSLTAKVVAWQRQAKFPRLSTTTHQKEDGK